LSSVFLLAKSLKNVIIGKKRGDTMTKGERIKHLREQQNMTQEELARRLNTTKQTISKYEKNIVTNIPSDRIEAIAIVLNSTPEYILGWEKVQKKADTITDVVLRMKTDSDFLSLVETLNNLDEEKIRSVKQMLSAFLK
jgi:transcriptional regulator with XRE-family HTH domain